MGSRGSARGTGTNCLECPPTDHGLHRPAGALINQPASESGAGAAAIKPLACRCPAGAGGAGEQPRAAVRAARRCDLHAASPPSVWASPRQPVCVQLAAQPRCDVRPRLPAEDPQRAGWCRFQAAPRSPLQHGLTRWHAPPELRRAAAAGPGPRAPGSWPAPRCHAHSCRTTRSSALRPPPAGRGGRLHPEPWQVPEAGAPLHPGPSPTPALGTPKPPLSSRGEPTRSPGHQARGQERRANASAACPQPLTGVFQVTEAAHLYPSLIITAWWPGAQAPVWSSHNASGVETS